jgi:hypothetical protein
MHLLKALSTENNVEIFITLEKFSVTASDWKDTVLKERNVERTI